MDVLCCGVCVCLGSERAAFSVVSCQTVQSSQGYGDVEERGKRNVFFQVCYCLFHDLDSTVSTHRNISYSCMTDTIFKHLYCQNKSLNAPLSVKM